MNTATLTKPTPTAESNHVGPEITFPTEQQLDATHRCDAGAFHGKDESCDAQAFVLVEYITGELEFCGHHYAKFPKVAEKALRIRDERAFMLPEKEPYKGNGLN